MNTIAVPAAKHLEIINAAHAEFSSGGCNTAARDATTAKVELLLASQEQPVGIQEDEKITFMDCVRAVPIVGQKSVPNSETTSGYEDEGKG